MIVSDKKLKQKVTFHRCTTADIDQIIQIAQTTYRQHYQYLWKDQGEHYIETSYNPTAIAAELADENVRLYLIQQGETVFGFLKINQDAAYGNCTAQEGMEIQRIYLKNEATGKGIGSATLREVDELAQRLGKRMVWLKVMDSSPALKFYQKGGYDISGETKLEVDGIFPHLQRQLVLTKRT
ncbi:MAG: GNAT family N-acetyltransferase [Bacteroidota bacterium]